MHGFLPKSGFLATDQNAYVCTGPVNEKEMVKELREQRSWIFYHFNRTGMGHKSMDHSTTAEDTRFAWLSDAEDKEDWIIDMYAANCEVTNIHHLDRYSLENIFTLPEKPKLLLLVQVYDNDTKFGGKVETIDKVQNLGRRKIGNREYYH